MCYIPDPIERMESRQDDLAWEWEAAQEGVPDGSYKCPFCSRIFDYEPVQFNARPDSPVGCADCAGIK